MEPLNYDPREPAPGPEDWIFAYQGKQVFYPGQWPRRETMTWEPQKEVYFGSFGGRSCWAWDSPGVESPHWMDLRDFFLNYEPDQAAWAGRGAQILMWTKNHRFCGACGTPTHRMPEEWSLACPACGFKVFPRISPAVIVLIHRDREILLARNSKAALGFWSLVAGFVESGETLEAAVHREVREEVGLEVEAPVYRTSQSWPFPDALMLGFTAAYQAGEPTPDGVEISHCGWFQEDNLPPLPRRGSSAHHLLEGFLGRSI